MKARAFSIVVALLATLAAGAFVVTRGLISAPESEPAALEEPDESDDGAPLVADRIVEDVTEEMAEPESEPQPAEPAFDASAPVVSETSPSGVSVTAPEGFLSTDAFARVETEISALTSAGHHVDVVLYDLSTGSSVIYNADERLYPASSIKALYSAMVCETSGGSGGMADVMERCLVDSSNEDYEALIDAYGMTAFGAWLRAHDAVEAADDGSVWYYPYISAGELASCWREIYRYGTSGEAGGAELSGYLARTNYTPMGALLRGECEVWAKPGWFPDNGELVATNDAGVVFSESGPYVFVVMTDLSADLDGLTPLLAALDEAHEVMCGGATA